MGDAGHEDVRRRGLTALDAASIRARLDGSRARIDGALAGVDRWLDRNGGWVAWSGGKDSTVCAWLAHEVRPGVPIVHFDSGLNFPETDWYLDETAAERGWNLCRLRVGDALEAMVATGTWDHEAPDVDVDAALERFWWVITGGPHELAVERFGSSMVIGLRSEEAARRARVLDRTLAVTLANGTRSYAPVGRWSTADVWAAHRVAGIGPNPVYGRLAELGVPEGERRAGLAVGSDAAHMGRLVWVKRGWPELWARACVVLPRLREKA